MSGIDISVLGMPELEKKLRKIEAVTQKKIVRAALRKSAKRVKVRVVSNLSGDKVNVQSGVLRDAFKSARIRSAGSRGVIRLGVAFPERDILGISPDDTAYYPTAVEYGHGDVKAHPYLRPAIDEHATVEKMMIGRDIGQAIEKL